MVILQLGSKFDWAGKFIRYFKHLHYSVFRRTSYKKYEKSYTLQFAKLCSLQFSLYQIMQNFHSGRIKIKPFISVFFFFCSGLYLCQVKHVFLGPGDGHDDAKQRCRGEPCYYFTSRYTETQWRTLLLLYIQVYRLSLIHI